MKRLISSKTTFLTLVFLSLLCGHLLAVDSRGTLVADTWRDQQSFGSIGRTIAVTPPSSGKAAVQFVYMEKASSSASHTPLWAWLAYDASVGAFIAPGGRKIGQCADTASSCTHYGLYPQITIDSTGIAYVSGNDYSASDGHIRYHTIRDSALLEGNFGYISDGSIRTSSSVQWPKIDMSEFSGAPVFYQAVMTGGEVKVYRKSGWSESTNDATWLLRYTDEAAEGGCDIVCDRASNRVGVAYVKPSANGGNDIWIARSNDGTTFVGTNVTQYNGNTYRAWQEVSALIDADKKIHLLWNASPWKGDNYDLWKSRLFHWSERGPLVISPVYSAEWDTLATQGHAWDYIFNIGRLSLAECDGKLFAFFSSFNDPITGHVDDCSDARVANGEIFVSVSDNLGGVGWNAPKNISESYTPNCAQGDCADDQLLGVSRYGMDESLYPTNDWSGATTYVLDDGAPNGKYLHVWYLTDRYPGDAGTNTSLMTNNELRWIRLACTPPIQSCQLAYAPQRIEQFYKLAGATGPIDRTITLENFCTGPITINSITPIEDSATAAGGAGWLTVSDIPLSVDQGTSAQFSVHLNSGNVIQQSGVYYGRVVIAFEPLPQTVTIPVTLMAGKGAYSPPFAIWDTLTTQCGLKLSVSNFGSMGNDYAGGANLNFPQPSPECDTSGGGLNAGDASIYLGAASPIIVRKTGVDSYAASWGVYSDDAQFSHTFKPMAESPTAGPFSTSRWEGYNSGVFCSADSSVKLQVTWWAPTGPTNADSCKFMIQRMKIYPFTPGVSVPNLAIGQIFDWDVPTDTAAPLYFGNVAFTDPTRRLVGMRGFTSVDTAISNHNCYFNARRYGGAAMIGMHLKSGISETAIYAGYNAASDSFLYPAGGLLPEQLWANMQSTGYSNESRITDLHSMLIYKNGASNVGWTLPANDTLTIWSVVAVVRPTGGTTAQGLDSLKKEIDKAKAWYYKPGIIAPFMCGGCCIGTTGNVNKGPAELPDLSDLSLMVTYLTSGPITLPCVCEADINLNGLVDLSDLSLLIAFLTADPRPTFPNCP